MKRFLHLLIFVSAFQMEVRVRASEAVSEPEGCLGRETPCSFKVSSDKWSYKSGVIELHASNGSVITEETKNREWTLISGTLWVENAPAAKIKTTTASAEGSSGQYWIVVDSKNNKIWYRNISSRLVVALKDNSKIEIPRGFEFWVGVVNSESQVEHGMVQPVDFKSHLKSWYSLYPGKRQQFLSEVQDLKDQWADRVEQSGEIYKKVAERKLAALDEEQRRQQELQRTKENQRRLIREQYHKKVFEY